MLELTTGVITAAGRDDVDLLKDLFEDELDDDVPDVDDLLDDVEVTSKLPALQ